ncbi:MAG: hypothetical protein WD011_08605 [Nitriliruptoraceae bacterium]
MAHEIRRTNRRSATRGMVYLVLIALSVLAVGALIATIMRVLVG